MSQRARAEATLRDLADRADAAIDLCEAALAVAALDRPGAALADYRGHVERLRDDVAALAGSADDADDRLAALREVIAESHGYAGDTETYDDLQNADLMRVIDRRRGLPVALGILYLGTAQALGWPAAGLGFPGHFLIRIEGGGTRLIVDPFEGGQVREADELRALIKLIRGPDADLTADHYAPVGNRDVLVRLHNNVKTRHLQAGRLRDAAKAVDTMLLFAPDRAALWYEAGALRAELGNLKAAIDAFETCVERSEHHTMRGSATAMLRHLRGALN